LLDPARSRQRRRRVPCPALAPPARSRRRRRRVPCPGSIGLAVAASRRAAAAPRRPRSPRRRAKPARREGERPPVRAHLGCARDGQGLPGPWMARQT